EYTRVALVAGEQADDVGLQFILFFGRFEIRAPGGLHPPGVVQTGNGSRLLTQMGIGIPNGVEDDEKRLDAVPVCDLQIFVDSPIKTPGILAPCQVMQEYAHGVHADALSISQIALDCS